MRKRLLHENHNRKYMIEGFCNIYFDANKGAYRRNDTSVAIDA